MTLNEQHAYVLKIEEKCKELGYEWIIKSATYYNIQVGDKYDIHVGDKFVFSVYLSVMSTYRVVTKGHNTTLPEFLDTHFQDMLNPTEEERTMWELETGTGWIF